MKAKIQNQILTFKTDFPAALITELPGTVKDKDGNVIYTLTFGDEPVVSKFGLKCNAVIDGYLAVQEVLPVNTEVEDVKRAYGLAFVAANAYIPVISDEIAGRQACIDSIFEGEEEA